MRDLEYEKQWHMAIYEEMRYKFSVNEEKQKGKR